MKKPQTPALILDTDPNTITAEAYRALRTNIQFAGLDHDYQKLLITSASPGEGKSTTVANLGVAMAQAGQRVCLVDSDLRHPTLHHHFGVTNGIGLTVALAGARSANQVVLSTQIPNLHLVPSGPLPPNPSEILGSQRMRQFVETLAGQFDRIIFDSPPVLAMADSAVLATLSDGVLLVVKVGTVPHDLLRRATEQIEAVKAKVLGVLLSQADLRRDSYYYRYYYQNYYSYYDQR